MDYALEPADFLVMGGFFVVLLGVGIFYAGRMHNLRDFFGGSRQVPWWLAGISLYMTTFSAFTFVAYSALAYQYGLVAVTIWWFSIPGCIASGWFLAAKWRRAATTSPVEYIEQRFSFALRQCFGWFGIPLIVLDDALKLFVIGGLVSLSLGLDAPNGMVVAIAACGLIILAYTLLGGLWAVLVTDCIQFVVMGIAVIVLVPLAYLRAGGAAAILDHAPEGWASIAAGPYTWPWLLSFGVILALTFATKWTYVQRYYAVRNDRDARRVAYFVGALTVIAPPLLFFPAFAARAFLPEITDTNQVFGLLCVELLPVGMMGILLAAMFSATMSMLSSDYNSVASVITNDIIKRLFAPGMSDRQSVFFARTATLIAGLLAMTLAILFARAERLEDLVTYMAQLFAALLPPVALPMIAGLISRRTSSTGALIGFGLGAACGATAYVLSYQGDFAYLRSVPYLTWITLLPTLLGLIGGSWLRPNTPAQREEIHRFLDGLVSRPQKKELLLADDGATVALWIIGVTTALLGAILAAGVLATGAGTLGGLSVLVGAAMVLGGGGAVWGAARLKAHAHAAAARED